MWEEEGEKEETYKEKEQEEEEKKGKKKINYCQKYETRSPSVSVRPVHFQIVFWVSKSPDFWSPVSTPFMVKTFQSIPNPPRVFLLSVSSPLRLRNKFEKKGSRD